MALEQGVNFLPGQSFHYQRDRVPYLRLAFGHLTLEQIRDGLPILARCIKSCRGSNEGRISLACLASKYKIRLW